MNRLSKMINKISVICLPLVLSLFSFQCGKNIAVKGVDLDISFSEKTLSGNLITDFLYKWKTEEEFINPGQDLNIFVHFWHKGNLLLTDDHTPKTAKSQWEPGKEYVYTRKIYIPPFLDEYSPDLKGKETLKISIGFFSSNDERDAVEQKIFNKTVPVLPFQKDSPEIVYGEGFYDLEIRPDTYLKQWRWTAKTARCLIDNSHRDCLLIIKGGINLDEQTLVFKINNLTLDEFVARDIFFEKSYQIKKDMLGDRDEFHLILSTDKTFVPAKIDPDSTDGRELGVCVSLIYIQ